jgi:hypothetical protein
MSQKPVTKAQSAGTNGKFIPQKAGILVYVTESARFIPTQSAGIPDKHTKSAGIITAKSAGIILGQSAGTNVPKSAGKSAGTSETHSNNESCSRSQGKS